MGPTGTVDGGDGGEGTHLAGGTLGTVHLSCQAVVTGATQGGAASTTFRTRRANTAA